MDAYIDIDWVKTVDDKQSTSSYFNFVTWRSKKQNFVAHWSAKAEFRSMAPGVCKTLWLRFLFRDLGYPPRQPIRLYCDNKAACDIWL